MYFEMERFLPNVIAQAALILKINSVKRQPLYFIDQSDAFVPNTNKPHVKFLLGNLQLRTPKLTFFSAMITGADQKEIGYISRTGGNPSSNPLVLNTRSWTYASALKLPHSKLLMPVNTHDAV